MISLSAFVHWQVRGDIARAVMYMAVSYGFHLSDSPNKGRIQAGKNVVIVLAFFFLFN